MIRIRARWWGLLLLAAGAGWWLRPARAEHFDMHVSVRTGAGVAEAGWDTTPPPDGRNPRASVTALLREEVTLEWMLRSEYPHGVMKQVPVALFVRPVADGGGALVEQAFTVDFPPGHAARGVVRFRPTAPGLYRVRLESRETEEEHGHDHFAAVDLRVLPRAAGGE